MMHETPLPVGYHPLPKGHSANVATFLEMMERPALRPAPKGEFKLERMGAADTDRFGALFLAIGQDFMWFSRLLLGEEQLAAIIGDPNVFCYALVKDGADIGLLLSSWGFCGATCPHDLNNDGKVNGGDLGLLLSGWGTCGN